jgi:hypothetical protein
MEVYVTTFKLATEVATPTFIANLPSRLNETFFLCVDWKIWLLHILEAPLPEVVQRTISSNSKYYRSLDLRRGTEVYNINIDLVTA